ncbi:MAG: glycoside hydrolase family 97 protein [Terricaulis silvestris]
MPVRVIAGRRFIVLISRQIKLGERRKPQIAARGHDVKNLLDRARLYLRALKLCGRIGVARLRFRATAASFLFLSVSAAHADDIAPLRSPSNAVEVRFSIVGYEPRYEVLYRGRSVIAPSSLGPQFRGGSIDRVSLIRTTRASVDRNYRLVAGKTSAVRDTYNEAIFSLQEEGGAGRRVDIVFRAYDDGAAFRYVFPAQQGLSNVEMWGERTAFNFPVDYDCWGFNVGHFQSNHEGEFDPVRASLIRPHHLYDLPLACHSDQVALAIAEADLNNSGGLYLSGRGDGGLGVVARLSPRLDDPGIAARFTVGPSGIALPWRVIMLGATPGALIESNLIANLNPPPDFDASWVHPGKSAWDWWSGSQTNVPHPGMNTETMRAYIDFAAANHLEYMLIDDGWFVGAHEWTPAADADITRPIPAIDMPTLIRYARQRHVGIWLWMHWRLLNARMEEAMTAYERWGVAGIKVDYMDRDDQEMVEFYHRVLSTAARHHLMVDLHGAYPPRGLARTYPNFLTQEGLMGAEYNKWSRRVTARHNVTLAYTRMLLGPMDYTPGGMRNATPEGFEPRFMLPEVMTTRAHGLAMYVVFDSPFESLADSPESYFGQAGFEFLREVPSSWDETRFLAGEVGEYIALARRHGRDWYVGVMNNETARDVSIPLSLLGSGHYRATLWADGGDATSVAKSELDVSSAGAPFQVHLAASGGAVVRLHYRGR